MNDAIGQPLAEGDYVAISSSNSGAIHTGVIDSFTERNVRVLYVTGWKSRDKATFLKCPAYLLKITQQYEHFKNEHPELLV